MTVAVGRHHGGVLEGSVLGGKGGEDESVRLLCHPAWRLSGEPSDSSYTTLTPPLSWLSTVSELSLPPHLTLPQHWCDTHASSIEKKQHLLSNKHSGQSPMLVLLSGLQFPSWTSQKASRDNTTHRFTSNKTSTNKTTRLGALSLSPLWPHKTITSYVIVWQHGIFNIATILF